jgi:hypothetical protein
VHEASCSEEPGAGKLHAGICEGGAGQPASLPRHHKMRHGMILSCHDSVFFHLVAAVPRCALRVSAVHLGVLQSHAYG